MDGKITVDFISGRTTLKYMRKGALCPPGFVKLGKYCLSEYTCNINKTLGKKGFGCF
jgi:hypothetical protein